MKKILAVIPARGGSKGIKNKNIIPLGNNPLISYTIKASLASKRINRTIVSTDNKKIADVAEQFGAEIPFKRPSEYAQDDTVDYWVFYHALKWLKKHEGYEPDLLVHLRPTQPFIPKGLIDKTVDHFMANPEADCLRTISPAPITPYKMWVKSNCYIKPFAKLEGKESYNMPRQELPEVYWHNGLIDIIKPSVILEKNSVSGEKILFFETDPKFAVDIDTPRDLLVAEQVLTKLAEEL